MPEYTVKQGDSTTSIAYDHGLQWETIWNHSSNTELRERRAHANILYPGDVIFIPVREEKLVSVSTEQLHRFRRRGVPEMLRISLLDEDDEPRSDIPYILEIDGRSFRGASNAEGIIEHPIPPNAMRGRLIVDESQEEEYHLNLGHLDPIDEISGVQARLNNLGFNYVGGDVNGEMETATVRALRAFQRKYNLPVTGEIDEATRRQLEELHQS
jgi:N-acetylmuramoyl-L-alanine amidase